jgi:adhesin transport system outer membrane protein
MAETQDVYLDDQRKITEQARVSWNSVGTSHENVIELQKTVVANTQTRDAYIKQFDIGQRGLLDLLNEDNELYLSKDNLVTATFAETFARFRLLAVAGGLEKALSVSPPEQAAVPVEQ